MIRVTSELSGVMVFMLSLLKISNHIMDHKVKCIWGGVGVVMAIPQLFGGVFLDDKATHIWTIYVEFFGRVDSHG